ncbi:MAG: hypothetical protein RQ745_03535 [Longimicrobiales bacterium]|nr:hypothetical protein [Longimicrobiales bacterium]
MSVATPSRRSVAAGGSVAVVLLALLGPPLSAQTAPELSYLRALGEHFGIPTSEVRILAEWRIPIDEIPVALAIADRVGISPDVIVSGRRSGRAWFELARRYGLDARAFHVRLDAPPAVVAALYARPESEWGSVEIDDAALIHLVNVSFLQEYARVLPDEASRAIVRHGSPAAALRALGR